jgi:hypothetical protein
MQVCCERLAPRASIFLLGLKAELMSDPLSIYLSDHSAGAKFAIDLLDYLRETHEKSSLGQFAERLVAEIKEDRAVLEKLSNDVGGTSFLKEASAWLAEKTARLKLRLGTDAGLGEFEVLETLSIGVVGKLKLWQALSQIADQDAHVRGLDLVRLIARAQEQHDEIELRRLEAAKKVLANPAANASK